MLHSEGQWGLGPRVGEHVYPTISSMLSTNPPQGIDIQDGAVLDSLSRQLGTSYISLLTRCYPAADYYLADILVCVHSLTDTTCWGFFVLPVRRAQHTHFTVTANSQDVEKLLDVSSNTLVCIICLHCS